MIDDEVHLRYNEVHLRYNGLMLAFPLSIDGSIGGSALIAEDVVQLRSNGEELFWKSEDAVIFEMDAAGRSIEERFEMEDELFLSSNDGRLLHVSPGKKVPATYEVLDERGAFDDDDYSPAMSADTEAVYWLAGPTRGTEASDDDPLALWATCY